MTGSVNEGILGKNGMLTVLPCWNRHVDPVVQRTLPKTGCLEDKKVDEIGYFKMLSVFPLFKK